ncbi:predicted protein [Plenodomus lingam JN3]|uniref:Predicted protein n=1 Tax=Leptosphaeria maculans (strain JN3 / isolate v23.1.3 / race Av1-4-5-6-7-8) TaxID=985895 RepID=E5A496_LEPMJ|nr:predicted protein [Plenodomus lingam JN3]CBX98441.1 predicted protein [Plenodomus lingam JN3]
MYMNGIKDQDDTNDRYSTRSVTSYVLRGLNQPLIDMLQDGILLVACIPEAWARARVKLSSPVPMRTLYMNTLTQNHGWRLVMPKREKDLDFRICGLEMHWNLTMGMLV